MNKEFVPYEQALALKELGAYIECFGFYWFNGSSNKWILETKEYESDYTKTISAPTFSQIFRWFREKYKIFGCVDLHVCTPAHWYIRIDDIIKNDYVYHSEDENVKYNTYEEAELECLKNLIQIVKEI